MNSNARKTRKLCEALHAKEAGYKTAGNIDFLLFIVGLILAMLIVRAFIFEPVRVDGESMENTLHNGERCIVEKVSYLFTSPKQGDIVIVHFPGRGNSAFVKRVIATAGQTVQVGSELVTDPVTHISDKHYFVLVDGERLDESAYEDTMLFDNGTYVEGTYTVPEGCIFVMGDHRTNSQDSRSVGPIPLSDVIGRVHGVIYPFRNFRFVD